MNTSISDGNNCRNSSRSVATGVIATSTWSERTVPTDPAIQQQQSSSLSSLPKLFLLLGSVVADVNVAPPSFILLVKLLASCHSCHAMMTDYAHVVQISALPHTSRGKLVSSQVLPMWKNSATADYSEHMRRRLKHEYPTLINSGCHN